MVFSKSSRYVWKVHAEKKRNIWKWKREGDGANCFWCEDWRQKPNVQKPSEQYTDTNKTIDGINGRTKRSEGDEHFSIIIYNVERDLSMYSMCLPALITEIDWLTILTWACVKYLALIIVIKFRCWIADLICIFSVLLPPSHSSSSGKSASRQNIYWNVSISMLCWMFGFSCKHFCRIHLFIGCNFRFSFDAWSLVFL